MSLNQKLNSGLIALKENKLNEAEEIFKNLIIKEPRNPKLIHFLGITYQLMNKIDEAIKNYKKTIEIEPDFAEAQKNLGNMFYKLGRIFEAEPFFKKTLEIEPNFTEATNILNIINEQKKVLSKLKLDKNLNENANKKTEFSLSSNPYIIKRPVEKELVNNLYEMETVELNKTKDIRYGNGKCSPNLKLFESNHKIIKKLETNLMDIMQKSLNAKIYVAESFFNILRTGSGTSPHRHLDPFDKAYRITTQKYSLVYYLSIGDQSSSEPGFLKLYDPDNQILPTEGLIVIFPADRKHSSTYNGNKDRIMIGVNFYSYI